MQPLDPSLFGGAPAVKSSTHAPAQATPDDSSLLSKGTDVWYHHRSGAWQPARVIAVDETIGPAFYQVRRLCLFGKSSKHTEI
jgi:hypothetical protein